MARTIDSEKERAGSRTRLRGLVVQVEDGDTFLVKVHRQQGPIKYKDYERVRMRRFNAPEMSERGGKSAKKRLEKRLYGRYVEVETYARHQTRLIGDVRVLPSRLRVPARGGKGPAGACPAPSDDSPLTRFLHLLLHPRDPDSAKQPEQTASPASRRRR